MTYARCAASTASVRHTRRATVRRRSEPRTAQALKMAEEYGFSINNYDNYVGTADLNDGEHQLDILAHLDVVPGRRGLDCDTAV